MTSTETAPLLLKELNQSCQAWVPLDTAQPICVKGLHQQSRSQTLKMNVSGSKSFTNRAIVLAALQGEPITLDGFLFSNDSFWGLESLARLEFSIEYDTTTEKVTITPPTQNAKSKLISSTEPISLFFGMAGTLARFFPAVLLNFEKIYGSPKTFLVSGEKRLQQRPLRDLLLALKDLGADIRQDSMPMFIGTSNLSGSTKISGAVSGQFLSGLLLAAAGATSPNPIIIERVDHLVQPDYVRMTLLSLAEFGSHIESSPDLVQFTVLPGAMKPRSHYTIEADASTACYFVVLALCHGLDLTILNIGSSSSQPDIGFLKVLIDLGANIDIDPSTIHVPKNPEPVRWQGNKTIDLSLCSDQGLTLAIVTLIKLKEPLTVKGIEHTRHHESDRIATLVANIKHLGGQCDEFPDGFRVYPLTSADLFSQGFCGLWQTHNDHRLAMSGAILASLFPEKIGIENPKCVEKTAPNFFKGMEYMGFHFSLWKNQVAD